MPTPRIVLALSSSVSSFQTACTVLRTSGVARGKTLHKTAPSIFATPVNFFTSDVAPPPNQVSVGMSVCRRTRRSSARPTCVCVLPMSKSKIITSADYADFCRIKISLETNLRSSMKSADSFLQRHVAADDAFQMAMFRADEQGPVVVERFRAATDFAVADVHRHIFADGRATGFPFVGHGGKFSAANPRVVKIQLAQNRRRQFRAGNFLARLDLQRRSELA